MKCSSLMLSVLLMGSVVLFGCQDGITSLDDVEVKSTNVSDNAAAFGKRGAPAITVGADVSEWDSSLLPEPLNGIIRIGGSGQINGEFTIAERDDIQIALRAQKRFAGPLEASGKNIGVYHAETGSTTPVGSNNATWNYDWHIDLRGSGTTLSDYDVTLHVTSVSNEVFGVKNPIDLTFGGEIPGNVVLYQQSWNPGFGNDHFDPNVEGTYNLRLRLSPKAGGPQLSVAIQVRVEDPA